MFIKIKIILILNLLFLNYFNLHSGSLQDFIKENYSETEFDELLGKGGTGSVWGSSSSDIVIKGGEEKAQCEKIMQEFELQKKIFSIFQDYDKNIFERIIILNPSKIIRSEENPNICGMEMPRLYPIKEETNKNLITQLQLGYESLDKVEKVEEAEIIRGHKIGFKETEEIVNTYEQISPLRTNMEQLCADIGEALAILHFKVKIDTLDCELCLAKEKKDSKNYKVAFIDFGMCKNIKNILDKIDKREDVIKKIIRAMTVEPIYPSPTTKCFKFFMDAYIKGAKTESKQFLAKKIMLSFIGEQFFKNTIIKKYIIEKLEINPRRIIQLKTFVPALYNWTKDQLFEKLQENEYNLPEDRAYFYLENIIPKIIEEKKKSEKLDRSEKILLNRLSKLKEEKEKLEIPKITL